MKRFVCSITKGLGFFIDTLLGLSTVLGASSLLIMCALILANIVGGYVFNYPILITHEVVGYCLVGAIFLGAGYTFRMQGHILIDLFSKRITGKAGKVLRLTNALIAFFTVVVVTYYNAKMVYVSYSLNAIPIGFLRIPLYLIQIVIPLGLAILAIELARLIIKEITNFVK